MPRPCRPAGEPFTVFVRHVASRAALRPAETPAVLDAQKGGRSWR